MDNFKKLLTTMLDQKLFELRINCIDFHLQTQVFIRQHF
jgi:hypothetical protein